MKWMMMKIEYLNLIHYFADGVDLFNMERKIEKNDDITNLCCVKFDC